MQWGFKSSIGEDQCVLQWSKWWKIYVKCCSYGTWALYHGFSHILSLTLFLASLLQGFLYNQQD